MKNGLVKETCSGEKIYCYKDDFYALCAKTKKKWTADLIELAWEKFSKVDEPVNDWIETFDKIIHNEYVKKLIEKRKKEKNLCQAVKKNNLPWKIEKPEGSPWFKPSKEDFSEIDMLERHYQKSQEH